MKFIKKSFRQRFRYILCEPHQLTVILKHMSYKLNKKEIFEASLNKYDNLVKIDRKYVPTFLAAAYLAKVKTIKIYSSFKSNSNEL